MHSGLGRKNWNDTAVWEPRCRFPRVLIRLYDLRTMVVIAEVPCYYAGSSVQPYPVSLHIRLRCSGAHEGHRQTLDPENLGGQPRWTSEEKYPLITALYPSLRHFLNQNDVSLQSRRHRQPLNAQRTRSKPYKDQWFARSLFLPSSLPLRVSATLCDRGGRA